MITQFQNNYTRCCTCSLVYLGMSMRCLYPILALLTSHWLPVLGCFLRFYIHHYSSGLNFESFGTLMKFWVCLKIRYPKIRMVYHHSPHQKLPFGLYTPFPDAPRPGCESLDADALAIPSKVNCIPLVFGIPICLYYIYMSIYTYIYMYKVGVLYIYIIIYYIHIHITCVYIFIYIYFSRPAFLLAGTTFDCKIPFLAGRWPP
jgi:hypothetical protein